MSEEVSAKVKKIVADHLGMKQKLPKNQVSLMT